MKPSEVAAIDLLALAAVELHRQGKPPTQAAEYWKYYGDFTNHVKFESEGEKRMHESLGTKEIESILRLEIENWIRWGMKRDWMPVGFRCPLGYLFKTTDVHEVSYKPLPCVDGVAADFERVVVGLPVKHREAIVMHLLDRAHANGLLVVVAGRDDKARLLGVQKSRYHELVAQAMNMVLREWRKRAAKQA